MQAPSRTDRGIIMETYIKKTKSKMKTMNSIKRQDIIFYVSMLFWPILQFLIFYLAMNINSLALSFQSYDALSGKYYFTGLNWFKKVISDLFNIASFGIYFKNSAIIWVFSLTVGLMLGVLVAYYIYKKCFAYGFFKILLFVPSVISGLVILSIFKQLADAGLPIVLEKLTGKYHVGILTNPKTAFVTILIYNVWFGVGGNMLLYLGTMDRISESVIESAKLEGISFFREFFSIVLPMIYPTFVVFFTVGVAGFFSNDMGLYAIYGKEADGSLMNIGYYLYICVLDATKDYYPYFSVMGLIFTIIVIPVTLLVRWALIKFGPSTD